MTARATLSAPAVNARGFPDRWLIWAAAGTVCAVALLLVHARLTLDVDGSAAALVALGGLLMIRGFIGLKSPLRIRHRIARDSAEYIGIFAAISLVCAIASYPDAADSGRYVDSTLQSFDTLCGFNWLAWYATVAAHPILQIGGRIAYGTIFVTPAILLGYFAYANRKSDAWLFLGTFWFAAAITLILFHFMPAVGPLAYLWHGPIPYMPTSALYQERLIPLLQHHSLHRIDLEELRGLVCVPSFHAAAAMLYTLAAWPIARLRWPVAILNSAMLLATPIEGTHYLADIVVGIMVALAAFFAMRAMVRRADSQVRLA